MIPAPTQVGPFWRRRVLECHCMVFKFNNPHAWARAYCPPTPMSPGGQLGYRKAHKAEALLHPNQRKRQS